MASVISLIIIVTVSILVTRVATIALVHTGMPENSAKFQARSAFTGVGFTTRESESIVAHPLRRKIIMILMLLGNVGIISVLASIILAFVNKDLGSKEWVYNIIVLSAGLLLLWYLANSQMVSQWLSKFINRLLRKYTNIQLRDYEGILHLKGEYEITEFYIDEDNWMVNKYLEDLHLRDEGFNVIGIERQNGLYIGLPDGATKINIGDSLILYGRSSAIKRLNERKQGKSGYIDHKKAVDQQKEIEALEKAVDEQ